MVMVVERDASGAISYVERPTRYTLVPNIGALYRRLLDGTWIRIDCTSGLELIHPAFKPPVSGICRLAALPAEILTQITASLSVEDRFSLRLSASFLGPFTREADADHEYRLDFWHAVNNREKLRTDDLFVCFRCFQVLPKDDFSQNATRRRKNIRGFRQYRSEVGKQFCRRCGRKASVAGARRGAARRREKRKVDQREKQLDELIGDSPKKQRIEEEGQKEQVVMAKPQDFTSAPSIFNFHY